MKKPRRKRKDTMTPKQKAVKVWELWSKEDKIYFAYLALYRVLTDYVLFKKITGPMPQMARPRKPKGENNE